MDRLPLELVMMVFQLLKVQVPPLDICNEQIRRGEAPLMNLCLTNKCFRKVATPLLYRTFVAKTYNTKRLRLFVRTLIQHPRLAKEVQKLAIGAFEYEVHEDEDWDSGFRTLSRNRIATRGVAKATKYLPPDLITQLKEGYAHSSSQDFELTMLLILCPGLRQIELVAMFSMETSVFMQVVKQVTTQNPPQLLRYLTEFSATQWDEIVPDSDGFELTDVLHFLHLPTLRTFRSTFIDGSGQPDSALTLASALPPNSSTVETITLDESMMTTSEIEVLVRACKALKTFGMRVFHDGGKAVDYVALSTALSRHKTTLRRIELCAIGEDDRNIAQPRQPMISLNDFSVLTHLEAEEVALLGEVNGKINIHSLPLSSALPSSIEVLKLGFCTHAILPHFEGMLANGKLRTRFPCLREIKIILFMFDSSADCLMSTTSDGERKCITHDGCIRHLLGIAAAFRAAGVRFDEPEEYV